MVVPKLCHRRDRNLAYITYRGKRIYLGSYGSMESGEKYAGALRILRQDKKIDPNTLQNLIINLQTTTPDTEKKQPGKQRKDKEKPARKGKKYPTKDSETSIPTAVQTHVAEDLFAAFIEEYKARPRNNKADLSRREYVRDLILTLCPKITTSTFGINEMKKIRDYLLQQTVKRNGKKQPLTANYVNKLLGTIKTAFRWGSTEGYCEGADYYRIAVFKNVDPEKTKARESSCHRTITEEEFEAVKKRVLPIYQDILSLLWNTGMRPSECCSMRWDEIHRNEKNGCWYYQPLIHKTSGKGKKRIIPLTDDEKRLIDQYKNDGDYVFTPKLARIQYKEIRRANRKTKPSPSQIRKLAQKNTGKQIAVCGKHINSKEFGKIIRRAVKAALMNSDLKEGWTAYDIRHTAITRFIITLGPKTAQYLAGHSHSHTTDIYDHGDEEVLFETVKRRQIQTRCN